MTTFIERMEDEKSQLDEKLQKLNSFMVSDSFTTLHYQDKALLAYQLHLMLGYSDVLSKRLNRAKGN